MKLIKYLYITALFYLLLFLFPIKALAMITASGTWSSRDKYTTCGGTVECTFPAEGGQTTGTYSGRCNQQSLKFGGRFEGHFSGGFDGTFAGIFNGWYTYVVQGQQGSGKRHGTWSGRITNNNTVTAKFVDSSGLGNDGNVHATFSKDEFRKEYEEYLDWLQPETPEEKALFNYCNGVYCHVQKPTSVVIEYNEDGTLTIDGEIYSSYEEWKKTWETRYAAPGVELYVKDYFKRARKWDSLVTRWNEAYVIRDGVRIRLERGWQLMPGDIIETKTDKGQVDVSHGRLHFHLEGEGSRVQVFAAEDLENEDWVKIVKQYGKPGEVLVMEPGTMVIKYQSQGKTGYHLPSKDDYDKDVEKCIGDECDPDKKPFVIISHDDYEQYALKQITEWEDEGYVWGPPNVTPEGQEEKEQNAAEMLLTWMYGLYVENKSTVEYNYDGEKLELEIKVYEGEADIRRMNFKTNESIPGTTVKAGESIKIALADFIPAKGEEGITKGEFDVNNKSKALMALEESIEKEGEDSGEKGLSNYIKIATGALVILVAAAIVFIITKKLLLKKGGGKSKASGEVKELKKHSAAVTVKIPKKTIIIVIFVLLLLVVGFLVFKNNNLLSNLFTPKGDEKVTTSADKERATTESDSIDKKREEEVEEKTPQSARPIDQFTQTQFKGKVAFERDRDIWSANTDGSNEKQLTTYKGLWSPLFSPNGQWIAYSSIPKELYGEGVAPTPSNIWIISPDGEDYKKLSQKYRVSTEVVWSPDSKKIAIATSDSTIVVFDINTGEELEFVSDAGPLGVIPYPPVWLTKDTFVYFRKLPDSPSKAGLALANIRTQKTEWLVEKPGIEQLAVSNNGNKLFYYLDREFYQVDIKTKKETKLNWDLPDNVSFIGDFKILKNSNTFMAPVHIDEEKIYPGSHIDFILINTISGKSVLKRTGLQYKKNLGWDSDSYWLVLNAVSPNDDIPTIWKVNLETEKKDQLINNAFSSTWHF